MNFTLKTFALGFVALASLSATAGTVKTWDFAGMRSNPEANVQEAVVRKIKAAVEQHCDDLSGGNDSVKLVSESVNHTDYYNYYGRQILQLEYSSFVLVRSAGDRSYTINVETSWDYDLPVPMVDAQVASTNCSFRP